MLKTSNIWLQIVTALQHVGHYEVRKSSTCPVGRIILQLSPWYDHTDVVMLFMIVITKWISVSLGFTQTVGWWNEPSVQFLFMWPYELPALLVEEISLQTFITAVFQNACRQRFRGQVWGVVVVIDLRVSPSCVCALHTCVCLCVCLCIHLCMRVSEWMVNNNNSLKKTRISLIGGGEEGDVEFPV